MFTSSSVTVTTPTDMARTLLFICFAQLIVTSVNTVEALELEETQLRQNISPRSTWTVFPGEYWTETDCPHYIGLENVKDEGQCQTVCDNNRNLGCNRINFDPRSAPFWCYMFACTATSPTGEDQEINAYLKQGACTAKRLCKISGGRCQHESEQCDGSLWSGNSYCKGKGCTCCAEINFSNGVLECTTQKQWTTALTTCLAENIKWSCIKSIKGCIAKIVACAIGKCFTV